MAGALMHRVERHVRLCDQRLAVLHRERDGPGREHGGEPFEDLLYRCAGVDREREIGG